jgi:hypothetical protein
MKLLALQLVLLVGCIGPRGQYTPLITPPPNAPFEERKAAFEKLRATGIGGQKKTFWKQGEIRYLELSDMRRVYQPEDLLVVVRPDSPTAQAVEEYREARRGRRFKRNLALALMGLGGAMIAAGIPIQVSSGKDSNGGFALIGLGTMTVLGGGVWAMTVQQNRIKFENHKSVMRAFEHYDRSLAAFLRICVNGTALVDCDAR